MSERNERMIAEFNATSSSRYGLLYPNRNEDWLRRQLLEKDRERDEAVRRAVEEMVQIAKTNSKEYKGTDKGYGNEFVVMFLEDYMQTLTPLTSDINTKGKMKQVFEEWDKKASELSETWDFELSVPAKPTSDISSEGNSK